MACLLVACDAVEPSTKGLCVGVSLSGFFLVVACLFLQEGQEGSTSFIRARLSVARGFSDPLSRIEGFSVLSHFEVERAFLCAHASDGFSCQHALS